jgi:glutamate N-acetyltransferase/amino-acid N-acetyltransferase
MCELTAAEVGIEPDQVLVASTGVIGHQLPMDKVTDGIDRAAAALSDSPRAGLWPSPTRS